MSYFNTQIICPQCEEDEHASPRYAEAKKAENDAASQRNYNFKGIGL